MHNLHTALDQFEVQVDELQGMRYSYMYIHVMMYTITHMYMHSYTFYMYNHYRDWVIKLFFSGDYEFLCVMFGLSGASGKLKAPTNGNAMIYTCITSYPLGRHCCLWCTIRGDQLKVPLSQRGRLPQRSLESLKHDHQRFMMLEGIPERSRSTTMSLVLHSSQFPWRR